MSLPEIHIRDSNFFSEKYPNRSCKSFNWIWDQEPKNNKLTVFTDNYIVEGVTNKSNIKVAWIIEPPAIVRDLYNYIENMYIFYDTIFTFDEDLLKISPKFVYYPYGTTWIGESDRKIYTKNKMLSTITSSKRFTDGQRLRHEAISIFKDSIDTMGRGYKEIGTKLEGLKDYRYSLTIENSRSCVYFTEKLLDCFMTGTIPIYWGRSKITDIFNKDGMLIFNDLNDLNSIINNLSESDYISRKDAITDNFNRALNYIDCDNHLWINGLDKIYSKYLSI